MEFPPTTLERAFSLARSGACSGVQDIRVRLRAEGFSLHPLEGPALMRQLRELCAASSAAVEPSDLSSTSPPAALAVGS